MQNFVSGTSTSKRTILEVDVPETALHKDKDRVRNATEEARAKARDRNATFYQILPWGKIAPGFLVYYIGIDI